MGFNESRGGERTWHTVAIAAGILILAAVEWICHRRIPFMMDDLWYATNLATDRPLQGLADIVESQVWHFRNWGGRCVTHGLLQMTLMAGEPVADILNMAALLGLGWMICVTAGWRKPFAFLLASALVVALNANVKMSMFWQAGTVNYVYSSLWILGFLWPYLRQVEQPGRRSLRLIDLWILPLGLMTGWSNENMGPASLLTVIAAMAWLKRREGLRPRRWMISGAAACLVGSVLVVVAPGNFVRASALEDMGLGELLYDRFLSMLRAGTDYLFPAVALLGGLLLLWMVCMRGSLRPVQWMLLGLAVLSYGAMALSPHYPDRATFGTMVVCIALSLSVLKDILEKRRDFSCYVYGMAFCYWGYAVYLLWSMG